MQSEGLPEDLRLDELCRTFGLSGEEKDITGQGKEELLEWLTLPLPFPTTATPFSFSFFLGDYRSESYQGKSNPLDIATGGIQWKSTDSARRHRQAVPHVLEREKRRILHQLFEPQCELGRCDTVNQSVIESKAEGHYRPDNDLPVSNYRFVYD